MRFAEILRQTFIRIKLSVVFYYNILSILEQGPEEDQDWKNKEHESRVGRIRQRRGRSIVHRSLEDNYGAVVVANHEALAQVLEQVGRLIQKIVMIKCMLINK